MPFTKKKKKVHGQIISTTSEYANLGTQTKQDTEITASQQIQVPDTDKTNTTLIFTYSTKLSALVEVVIISQH